MMPHGVTLIRHAAPGVVHPDTLGTEANWAQPIHQLYAQMPFPGLFRGLQLNVWDERNSTLQQVAASQSAPSLLDYDLSQPGSQRAVGLHWPGQARIDLLVTASWTPTHARRVLSHEFGHYYQHACGLRLTGTESTPARRALASLWHAFRPEQGHNTFEDWAEVYRAVAGCNETRGTYSDGKQASLPGTMRSLIRCAYWFSRIQDTVSDVELGDFYLIWRQELPWFRSEWRYLNTDNFTLYAWRNAAWQQI